MKQWQGLKSMKAELFPFTSFPFFSSSFPRSNILSLIDECIKTSGRRREVLLVERPADHNLTHDDGNIRKRDSWGKKRRKISWERKGTELRKRREGMGVKIDMLGFAEDSSFNYDHVTGHGEWMREKLRAGGRNWTKEREIERERKIGGRKKMKNTTRK